ncbi:monovalent cation/H(+) antiporter subunit G [Devosia sp. YIM 151766]|uniref:monovalent cation/H(+) antiporter subunit G n=1 Tax=Devosia sp. YIM 151766 TaxID=3017325 RepID=UPI00255C89FB|nr:monovalent cation/H(+) antiporter subunit G [Devosia sp. YIM 151766]WIY53641.1 monovalent cation/H(+) antiporter subunit G [Devosia sp. YIM 151766]
MLANLAVYAGGIMLLLGAIFTLIATIGVVRLPDLYTRMHAASKAGAVGGGLILVAVALVEQDSSVSVRALIGIIFLLLTTPLSAHLLARASHLAGYRPDKRTVIDDINKNAEQNSAQK